jgi:hypothetical protein
VEFSQGVGFAQAQGQAPRTLGKGLALSEGDRLTTSQGAIAIVKLRDGTRMTLRPNSDLVLQKYQFKAGAPDNSMLVQLLRGGLRAITGLISKRAPDAARIQTVTATIGIRGTDFDARICTKDCAAEARKFHMAPRPNLVTASAKVAMVQGVIEAIDSAGERRLMISGGSVYPGETVVTGAGTRAVLAFRDESRMTLGPSTRFRLDNFVFDQKNPSEGRFLVSLLRGSLRALTGLIGKANSRNVGYSTTTATIGIRGTGLDLDCSTETSCSFFTWLGTIEVTPQGTTALQALEAGQGLYVGADGIRALGASTLDGLPRPDQVDIDFRQLFGGFGGTPEDEGLFVRVRDGHIEIRTAREVVHLGRGETGFAGADGGAWRPFFTPLDLEFDQTPMPDSRNPWLGTVLGDLGVRDAIQCIR